MTIAAPVYEREENAEGNKRNLGVYEFEQLPVPGDGFNIPHANGRVGRYRVLRLVHEPLMQGAPSIPDRYSAFVYVALIDEFW